jgi:hypothetical protein
MIKALLGAFVALAAGAQSSDVVSVKPATVGRPVMSIETSPGRFLEPESTRRPVEVLVIDTIARPSPD